MYCGLGACYFEANSYKDVREQGAVYADCMSELHIISKFLKGAEASSIKAVVKVLKCIQSTIIGMIGRHCYAFIFYPKIALAFGERVDALSGIDGGVDAVRRVGAIAIGGLIMPIMSEEDEGHHQHQKSYHAAVMMLSCQQEA